ncbi:immunoglobulin superfamily member 1-like [Gopherus evgoodei]|uniref:immunoglobulin superfamily member 1-like n=1 Tax=Gopherus evgoodei TaxID=1825980 RepID=UPI0011CF0EE8|nr:immunoglobulin superfamily member 1-like [Gopherus evgoodei]
MALTHLLPVLACLLTVPQLVSPAAFPDVAPRAPTLSVNPHRPAYLSGESLSLTCSAPGGDQVVQFQLWKNGAAQPPMDSHRQRVHSFPLAQLGVQDSGTYTCLYHVQQSEGQRQSWRSNPVSISVYDHPAAPALSVSPQRPVYLPGEAVTLQCMAPPGAHPATGFLLSRVGGRNLSSGSSDTHTLSITGLGDAGSFTCLYWICPSRWRIQSWESRPISINVTDPPSQPVLSVDPQSGAVREGLPLLISCIAPGDTGDRRFHFYKGGDELVPGDVESEISTTEPGTSSVNVSVLRIPQAGPNNTGVFTCGYEENVGGRWIPSPRSRAVNVTVNVTVTALAQPRNMLLACGILVVLGMALTALVCYCRRNKRVPEPSQYLRGSEPGGGDVELDSRGCHEEPKPSSVGVELPGEGSDVYTLLTFPSSATP